MPIRDGIYTEWQRKVKIKHLLTRDETPDAVRKSMNAIYAVLRSTLAFKDFDMLDFFRECDDLEEANGLLDLMYDYANENLIWIW